MTDAEGPKFVRGRVMVATEPGMSLFHYPEDGIVAHELERYPGAAVLEALLDRGVGLLEAGARGWLSDDRRGGALPKSHHVWAETVWGPKAVRAGWKFWALVPPKELLGSRNMARVMGIYAGMGVVCQAFSTPQQGLDWLRAVGTTK